MKAIYEKYRELILYVVFGLLTTAVNWLSYLAAVALLGGAGNSAAVIAATVIGQVLSILFAYFTNRKWVFQSKAKGVKGVAAEMGKFFGCRGVSFFLDIALMYLGVTVFKLNDSLMKLLSNVVIVAINYVLSKVFVFRKKEKQK